MSRAPLVLAVVTGCLTLAACTGGESGTPTTQASTTVVSTVPPTTVPPTTAAPTTVPITVPTTAVPVDPVADLMAGLTVEQKVGQLLMPVMAGTVADQVGPDEGAANVALGGHATPAELVSVYQLGGVIYLGPNVESADQLTELSVGLQEASSPTGIGLLISVDQEGGRVARVSDRVPDVPAARTLSGDPLAILTSSFVTGWQLQKQGINMVLAPVADLGLAESGVIGDRAYSSDPEIVAEMVASAVRGLQLSGVAAVVKHWPGHGATSVDSHRSLPVIDVDREEWANRERVPFASAVAADVSAVMVGHLALPGLDPDGRPATISPVLVDELLRQELGFDGVVMTDALDMGAVSDIERAELAVQVIEAGGDVLLAPPDLAAAHQGLLDAVSSGRISSERLDASVGRILRLKHELGLVAAG